MSNFAILRMGALSAERNAMKDDIPVIDLDDSTDGAKDSTPEPSITSFFNGKPHAEGLKAYNEWLALRGVAPIPTGKK
jgi:hypothetical protein